MLSKPPPLTAPSPAPNPIRRAIANRGVNPANSFFKSFAITSGNIGGRPSLTARRTKRSLIG